VIRVAISAEAFAAIEREIWLDEGSSTACALMRGPRESYSDVILRLAADLMKQL
jgi:hypothetical protein